MASIKYRFPCTVVLVTGTLRTTRDEYGPDKTELVASEVGLATSADLDQPEMELELDGGALETYKSNLGITPDGRLSSFASESQGEAGTVLRSLASLAGAILSVAMLNDGSEAAAQEKRKEIFDGYRKDHGEEADELKALRDTRSTLEADLRGLLADPAFDIVNARALRTRLRLLGERLEGLEAHFQVWRKTKIETVDQTFEMRVDLGEVPEGVSERETRDQGSEPPGDLKELWDRFGLGVEGSWLTHRPAGTPNAPSGKSSAIHTRRAGVFELRLMKADGSKAVETGRTRGVAGNAGSEAVSFQPEKKWFGKRGMQLSFDADGFLASIGSEGSSELAAGLSAATGAIGDFASGVETGTKAYKAVRAAGHVALDAELERLKTETGITEQRILAKGLEVTADDAAELKRLEQLSGILEAQTKIRDGDPALVSNLLAGAGGDLSWYSPPPPGKPAEPQEIRIFFGSDDDPGEQSGGTGLGGPED